MMKRVEKRYGRAAAIPFLFPESFLKYKQYMHVLRYMVQTRLNNISQEVHEMDSSDQVTYEEKNMTVKVERVFIGEKTAKELVLELLRKRWEAGELWP